MGVETNAASLCRKRVKQPSFLGKEGVNNNYPQLFIAENQETVKTFISLAKKHAIDQGDDISYVHVTSAGTGDEVLLNARAREMEYVGGPW